MSNFPSQLLEHWLDTPEVLSRYCVHHETGEPLPQELIDKIKKANTFNQGFDTVEYLASALIDMKLHTTDQSPIDPDKFERETLAEIGMPKELPMRHRTPQFSHIFSSDAYSAGYYSYSVVRCAHRGCSRGFRRSREAITTRRLQNASM